MTDPENGSGEVFDARSSFAARRRRAKQRPSNTGSYAPVFHVPRYREPDGTISEPLNASMTHTLGEVAKLTDFLSQDYAESSDDKAPDEPDTL